MINYDLFSAPSSSEDSKKLFARPISSGTIDTNQLIDQIRVNEGFIDVAEARKVMDKVCQAIKNSIADGYNIHINGLGFFSPKLTTTWPNDKRRTTPDVAVDSINFVAEKEVKEELAEIITTPCLRPYHSYGTPLTDDQLDTIVLQHFEEEPTITRKQLQVLATFLSKNAACAYLTRAIDRGFLRNVASKSNPVYMKA